MGNGTAWGGHLPCKQEIRRDRYSYSPPIWRDTVIGNGAALKADVSASIRRAGSSPALAAILVY